jgi:CRP-like cAMP-binding protein
MDVANQPRRVRLLDVEPDLARFLTDTERAEMRPLTVPVVQVPKGDARIGASRIDRHAFGALVLDGMLLQRFRFADHETMRPIGPGDLLALEEPRMPSFLSAGSRSAISDTRLAILGADFMAAARRWPGLIAALHIRSSEQAERVSAQLAICQLPRVADRLLAMMWLLAESWGRVTPSGVTLPLVVTHEALGALIGARRPTVSLAVAELVERGAVVRQRTGWLILEEVPAPVARVPHAEPPVLHNPAVSPWTTPPPPPPPQRDRELGTVLTETLDRLRTDLRTAQEQVGTTIADAKRARERARVGRERRAAQTVRR